MSISVGEGDVWERSADQQAAGTHSAEHAGAAGPGHGLHVRQPGRRDVAATSDEGDSGGKTARRVGVA